MKGQAALEFSFMIMFAMTALGVFLIVIAFYSLRVSNARADAEMNDLADTLQQEFLLAAAVPDGYRRNITLPDRIERFNYHISATETFISLNLSNNLIATRLVPAFTGTITKGTNTITKQNGEVFIS